MSLEKQVSYASTNTYSTLNTYTAQTRNIWIVCHGIGYLSKYFIRHFRHLDIKTNFIIAPQAPSRYYQDKTYKYIGASWFTRNDLNQEIQNACNYLDAIYEKEVAPQLKDHVNHILMGYSQGVSAVTRWAAHSKINCSKLLLHSGGIPDELKTADFRHFNDCKIHIIYGDNDPHLNKARLSEEKQKYNNLWGSDYSVSTFKGGHEVNMAFIAKNG